MIIKFIYQLAPCHAVESSSPCHMLLYVCVCVYQNWCCPASLAGFRKQTRDARTDLSCGEERGIVDTRIGQKATDEIASCRPESRIQLLVPAGVGENRTRARRRHGDVNQFNIQLHAPRLSTSYYRPYIRRITSARKSWNKNQRRKIVLSVVVQL